MNLILLAKGLLLGISLSIPIGPVGILCLRYNLLRGRMAGFLAGLGAATADMVYAAFAAFGIAFVLNPINNHELLFKAIAGFFLCIIGFHLYRSKQTTPQQLSRKNPAKNFFSTFFLTLSNPTTIFLFVTLFALFDIEDTAQIPLNGAILVSAVFLGATIGWLSLALITHQFRAKMTPTILEKINKIAGASIVIFGIISLSSLLL